MTTNTPFALNRKETFTSNSGRKSKSFECLICVNLTPICMLVQWSASQLFVAWIVFHFSFLFSLACFTLSREHCFRPFNFRRFSLHSMFIANIFGCKIYSFAAMCTKHKHTRPKHRTLDTFSQFNWEAMTLTAPLPLLPSFTLYFSLPFNFFCVHAFRFVCLVNLNRQFINIKFCSALFSVRLLLALFGALNAECIHI